MGNKQSVSDGPGDGDAPGVHSAAAAPPPAASLLGLPTSLLDDILRRALQHGTGEALSLSCRALSQTRLQHAPSFRFELDNRQCDQLLTPRITAALRARTDKLTLILEQLQRLSLDVNSLSFVSGMEHLAQHLTQLRVVDIYFLEPQIWLADRVPQLLQPLPLLRTLQLPDAMVKGHQELDALLAATQLTSVQLKAVQGLTHAYPDVHCSWQRLELTGAIDVATAAYLPLHTLTQPLVLSCLHIHHSDSNLLLAAAAQNLTQGGKLPPRVRVLNVRLWEEAMTLEQTAALLQPLHGCCCGKVRFDDFEDVSVQHVAFEYSGGAASSAMCECLFLMAEQPWARWLDITIEPPPLALYHPLPQCCQAVNNTFNNPSEPRKFRACFKA
ncbi:hypothetical protein QJQ45_015294 [Haematococcus lacustris]|nr:hypothetical protein QJQ45_015294 [Haematococcus lacustris]